jgi:citrate synthase
VVAGRRERKQAIPGYGHPEHKARDRRVDALFEVSRKAGGGQHFVQIAQAVEDLIPGIVGKDLKLNVSAAIPAVLLGVGFPVGALKGVPILARTASLIAHLNEEMSDPIGFALSYQAMREFEYTGAMPEERK